MKQQRNVEGLRQNAQKKRQEAIERAEQGIKQLIKEGKPINFEAVAAVSGVSKAWLYKEPDLKTRIQQLRVQGTKKNVPPAQKSLDSSKNAIIATLKERIKRLEQKNCELGKQLEVFGGQVLKVRELEYQVKKLQAENEKLSQKLDSLPSRQQGGFEVEHRKTELVASDAESALIDLGVQLNSTIKELIRTAPQDVIQKAIEALREAAIEGRVKNPSGFFNIAATNAWNPNQNFKQKSEYDIFKEWYPLAKDAGLVCAAHGSGGLQLVLTSDEQWVAFSEILDQYPLESLRSQARVTSPLKSPTSGF